MIAITAAANTMGVPPAVAASTLAAAKSGDKKAQKELEQALSVYQSAHKGDPVALRQIASVKKDMAAGYAPAAVKAAFLSAAAGASKGARTYKSRTVKAPNFTRLVGSLPGKSSLIQFGNVYDPYAVAITQGRRFV